MAQRITDKDLYNALHSLANSVGKPIDWFNLNGAYGYTTLDMRYIDSKTGELTTGTTRLATGTKREVYDCMRFMCEVNYQITRNENRQKESNIQKPLDNE